MSGNRESSDRLFGGCSPHSRAGTDTVVWWSCSPATKISIQVTRKISPALGVVDLRGMIRLAASDVTPVRSCREMPAPGFVLSRARPQPCCAAPRRAGRLIALLGW